MNPRRARVGAPNCGNFSGTVCSLVFGFFGKRTINHGVVLHPQQINVVTISPKKNERQNIGLDKISLRSVRNHDISQFSPIARGQIEKISQRSFKIAIVGL